MQRYWWLFISLALSAVLFSAALARDDSGGKPDGRERRGGPPVVFGEITALSKNAMTLKPELPERMEQRMQERQRERPRLPDSITLKLGPDTKWYFDGATGSRKDFAVGDKVVVKLLRGKDEKSPTAEAVADPETAKQYIMDKMRERREGGPGEGGRGDWSPGGDGRGGPAGGMGFGPGSEVDPGFGPGGDDGQPGRGEWKMDRGERGERGEREMGPGGPGARGMGRGGPGGPGGQRPAFGAITAINKDSVTIKPEIPDFVKDKLEQHDIELPDRLPESLSMPLDELTVFVNNGAKVNKNPFGKGDRVVLLMCRGLDDQPCVRAIIDIKTAKAMLEQLLQGRGGKGRAQADGQDNAGKKHQQQDQGSGSKRRNPR